MTTKSDESFSATVAEKPDEAAEAAWTLNRMRWGRTRTDRLVSELQERRADLLPDQVEQLRALVLAAEVKGKS
jgi:hypothetical protein